MEVSLWIVFLVTLAATLWVFRRLRLGGLKPPPFYDSVTRRQPVRVVKPKSVAVNPTPYTIYRSADCALIPNEMTGTRKEVCTDPYRSV